MPVLDLTATTDDARSDASISALGTAATIAVKIRLNGACLLAATAYNRRLIWEIGSLAGAVRAQVHYYHNPSPTPDRVDLQVRASDGANIEAGYDRTAIVSGDYYIIYANLGAAGMALVLFDAAGNILAQTSDAGTSLGNSNSANGKISVGQGVNAAVITDSMVGRVDGIAVYSAALAGDARWSAPSSGDANLLSMVCFDEGTGTSANDVAAGGSDMTLSGAGWQAGGTWDGAVATSRNLILRRRREWAA